MEELISKISQETIDELKKIKKPAYPLYYKDVFNAIAKEKNIIEQINPKLLCIEPSVSEKLINATEDTIKTFHEKSSAIKDSSKEIIEELNEIDSEEVKATVIKFSAFLIKNMEELEKKIKDLESELDKAYKDLLMDPLTKAYNRKALERDLLEILEKGKEKNLDLCLAIIDMDNFKFINDKYGHLVGDFVLIKFVQIMRSLLRKTDKIYRYGGDEFIIVFNRSNLSNAQKSIERILNKLEKTKLKYKDFIITLTVSAGITCHKKGDDIDSIIERADEALYEAKVTKNTLKVK